MSNWQEIKTSGGLWVQKHSFWLFGTLTCFEQRKSFEGEDLRQKQYRLLFNTLDRQLLKRKYTNTDLIKDTLAKNWQEFGTIKLRDNDNSQHASSYCYKEKDSTFNYICSTVTPTQ